MSIWSDAKAAARQSVQDTMGMPAVFYATAASTPTVEDDTVSVRVHDKMVPVGDLAGTSLSYAEVMERPTRAIFLVSEMEGRALARGSMILLQDYTGAAKGYFIDNVHPADGLTRTCDVTPLSASEMSGKLLPDGGTV